MLTLILSTMLSLGAASAVAVPPTETLNIVRAGAGETVVLLPGLSGCAFAYRKIVPLLLDAGFEAVIVEPLGVGSSSKPEGADYSLTAQADRLAAALDSLQAGPSVVMGHAVAASVAMRLAYRRPDLVRAVVSVEGGPDEAAGTPAVERSLKIASVVAKLGGKRLLRDRLRSTLEAASGDRSWVDGLTVRKYFANAARDMSAAIGALRAMARAEEPESLRGNLGRIHCPVILLAGGAPHDGGLSAEEVSILCQGLPDFTLQVVPGAGHFIFEEQPEAVASAIIAAAESTRLQVSRLTADRAAGPASDERRVPCAQ